MKGVSMTLARRNERRILYNVDEEGDEEEEEEEDGFVNGSSTSLHIPVRDLISLQRP